MKTPHFRAAFSTLHLSSTHFGPSGATRTPGLLNPNQARYQLRYTRIFNFCHYITARGKIKVFSVCGHLCGQSRFYTVFGNRWKSRKRRCHKALRRFASPYPGYRHGTPKASALPTALHPDIQFFLHDTMRRRKKQVFRVCGRRCGQARFCESFSTGEFPPQATVPKASGSSLSGKWIGYLSSQKGRHTTNCANLEQTVLV